MAQFELSDELKEKLKACKTPEDVLALAKENNLPINLDEAKNAIGGLMQKIPDEHLDKVAGGCCWETCGEQSGC